MIHIPVNHRTISASNELKKFQDSLFKIALYAKAANQMEIYNQAKQAHDNMARQFNTRYRPAKKGFWQKFKDNILMNMDIEEFVPERYFDEKDIGFSGFYQYAESLPLNELLTALNDAIADHNRRYGE